MTYMLNSVYKRPKFLTTSHTSNQTTSTSARVDCIVDGSEISYTPVPDATNVVYEISYYGQRINYVFFQCIHLEHYVSGSWTEINNKYLKNIGNTGPAAQSARFYMHIRYVIPTWSGSRDFRINTLAHYANREVSLHQLTNWDGASVTNRFCNTNVLMYSV